MDFDNDGCLLVDRIFEDGPFVCPTDFPISEETKEELHDGVMLLFPQHILVDEFSFAEGKVHAHGDSTQEQLKEEKGWTPVLVMRGRSANRGRSLASGDGRSYDNVVRGNKIWVLHSDLVFKWCLMAYGGSDTGIAGGKSGVAEQANESESKGKCVKEVTDLETGEEVFMEIEEGVIEQVQIGGNREMIRSEAKKGAGPSYNLEDVH
ncbi:hypothetical protein ACFX10_027650 [Malus domestica]